MQRLERSSVLAVDAAEMWTHATTPEGINDELSPILRMTMPARVRGLTIDDFPVGTPAGRSWILLFGILPVDYDDLCLVELEPGRRFLERSSMATLSVWEHERVIEPAGPGRCTVTDRLGFEMRTLLVRLPGSERLAGAIVGSLFAHRHRRLIKRFGAA